MTDHDNEPDLIPTEFDVERIMALELAKPHGPSPDWLCGEKGTWRIMPYHKDYFVLVSFRRGGKQIDAHFDCAKPELIVACLNAMNERILKSL